MKAAARGNYEAHRYERMVQKRQHYIAYHALVRAQHREPYEKNRERSLSYCKTYRALHRDSVRKQREAYRCEHREKLRKLSVAYRQARPDRSAACIARWRKTPGGKEITKQDNARSYHQRRALGPLDVDGFYVKCEALGWHCQICGKGLDRSTVTIDHAVSVSKGGTNVLNNLQPLCRHCNSYKRARTMKQMLGSRFLFGNPAEGAM